MEISASSDNNFIPSEDAEEEHVVHSKVENIKFKFYNEANEVVDEHCESLCSRYQANLETTMRGSNFIFYSVQLIYYKCHKVNSRHGGPYIDSPDWIKKKKVTMNQKNTDDKYFQYVVTVAQNYKEIESQP